MKTHTTFFSLVAFVFATGLTDASAQGRGNENRRDRDRLDRQHENGNTHYRHDRDRYAHYDRDRRQAVVIHTAHPRYIYYRDYDVYYDYQKSVYIYASGRGWTVSRFAPVSMRYVDVRHAKRYEIDYHDDDFVHYLDRRGRPKFGRECNW